MKNKLLMLAITATCVGWSPAAAYPDTEEERKDFLRGLVQNFHYTCPEVKSYQPLEGSRSELLIICGELTNDDGNRDMGYVIDTANDNDVRKVKIAPRTYWEWFADWF